MEDKVIQYYPRQIAEEQLLIEGMSADLPVVQSHPAKDNAFSMTVQGTVYKERKAAGEAIIKICSKITDPKAVVDLGEYRGFSMRASFNGTEFKVSLKGQLTYSAVLSDDPVGSVARINNALETIESSLQAHKAARERLENDMAAAKAESEKPFPKEDELREKMERLNQLNKELEVSPKEQDEESPEQDAESAEAQDEWDGETDETEEWGDEPDEAEPPSRETYRREPETPRQSERKPSIREELRGYTPPARVAAPSERSRSGVML